MPKKLKDINQAVMNQIRQGKLKMRPKVYFILGSLLTFTGLVFSVFTSIFFISLMRFSLQSYGPMAKYRLEHLLSIFPWWVIIPAILGLVIGIWLLRQYSFSYKISFKMIAIGFVIAIIIAGWLIDIIGLNNVLLQQRPMQGMRQYFQERNIQPGLNGGKIRNALPEFRNSR